MNLNDKLVQVIPEVMAEFNKKPWNYNIFAPCSMEDEAELTIFLKVGEHSAERAYRVVAHIDVISCEVERKPEFEDNEVADDSQTEKEG